MNFETRHSPHIPRPINPYRCYVGLLMSRCDPATLARMIHERDRRGTKFEVPKTSNF